MKNNIFSEYWYTLRTYPERCKKSAILIAIISGILASLIAMLLDREVYVFGLFYRFVIDGKIAFVFIFLLLFMLYMRLLMSVDNDSIEDKERNYLGTKRGDKGTASLMEDDEKERTFNSGDIYTMTDDFIGEDKEHPGVLLALKEQFGINKNTLIVGGPASGKSACIIMNHLLQIIRRGESAIVSDPKGELFAKISEIAKKYGMKIRILNINPAMINNSDSINFMGHIHDTSKAQSFAHAIISNVADEPGFWRDGAENLATALTLYIVMSEDYTAEEKNIVTLYDILTTSTVKKLEAMFDALPPNHPARNPFNKFANGDNTIKGNTLTGLGYKLNAFDDPELRKILKGGKGSIEFVAPGREPCMYFIGKSDQDSSRDFIVALFYTMLYQELVAYADMRKDQQLPIPVNMILDEFANSGRIPDFEKKLSTVRSRRICTTIVLQDINQLAAMYPCDQWGTIISDCDLFILLKTNEINTMKFFSTLCGKQSVKDRSKTYDESVMDPIKEHSDYGVKEGITQRDLFTLDEIRRLDINEMLVIPSTRQPILMKKYMVFENKDAGHPGHPLFKEMIKVLPIQHYPFWRQIAEKVVTPDFDYDMEPTNILPAPIDSEDIKVKPPYIPIFDKKSSTKKEQAEVNNNLDNVVQKLFIKLSNNYTDVSIVDGDSLTNDSILAESSDGILSKGIDYEQLERETSANILKAEGDNEHKTSNYDEDYITNSYMTIKTMVYGTDLTNTANDEEEQTEEMEQSEWFTAPDMEDVMKGEYDDDEIRLQKEAKSSSKKNSFTRQN